MRLNTRWLVVLGCLGPVVFGGFLWAAEHTAPPVLPLAVAIVLLVIGLVVGPWMVLAAGRLKAEPAADRVFRRVLTVVALFAGVGTFMAVAIGGEPGEASVAAVMAILAAGALALVGAVVFPWLFLLARTVTRERAARVRAEERAEVAAHLHDSVLQALTLIQKRAEDSAAVRRLARGTERELRAWLYGAPTAGGDDLAGAIRALAEEVEDRFAVSVELVTVGTCGLNGKAQAVVGAVREALTNAAKHAQVPRVSVFAEVADAEVFALIRDRGRGFDPAGPNGSDRRGITGSIVGRMRQQGGTATIRSALGEGTEVELHMPVAGGT